MYLFVKPLNYPLHGLEVRRRVERLGISSVRFGFTLFRKDEDVSSSPGYWRFNIFIDRESFRSAPMPEHSRTVFAKYLVEGFGRRRRVRRLCTWPDAWHARRHGTRSPSYCRLLSLVNSRWVSARLIFDTTPAARRVLRFPFPAQMERQMSPQSLKEVLAALMEFYARTSGGAAPTGV